MQIKLKIYIIKAAENLLRDINKTRRIIWR